jgi:glutamine amidotransferase
VIGIVDYGMGNLKSVRKALEHLGIKYIISGNIEELDKCEKLIIPGVGAFGMAMENLNKKGLTSYLKNCNKPIMGVCLGMQLLFSYGHEDGLNEGLGFIPGDVLHLTKGYETEDIDYSKLKIPHMGWNTVNGKHYYFVHSYYADCDPKYVVGYADYGIKVPAIVQNGQVIGCQFHPEKSGDDGLEILKIFGGTSK